MSKQEEAKKLVGNITDFVNTFGDHSEHFNNAMDMEHRTLQQSFTRLALKWLEHCATDEYRTDGRNEGTKKVCKTLVESFKKEEGTISPPSDFLGYI